MDPDLDPCADTDPAIFSSLTFKMLTKNNFFLKSSAYYFLKVHLHHFSKKKLKKNSQSNRNQRLFLLFLLGTVLKDPDPDPNL
jgi:hypothetical protein